MGVSRGGTRIISPPSSKLFPFEVVSVKNKKRVGQVLTWCWRRAEEYWQRVTMNTAWAVAAGTGLGRGWGQGGRVPADTRCLGSKTFLMDGRTRGGGQR